MGLNAGSCRVDGKTFATRTKQIIEDLVDDRAPFSVDGDTITIKSVDSKMIEDIKGYAYRVNRELKSMAHVVIGTSDYPNYISVSIDKGNGKITIELNNPTMYSTITSRYNEYTKGNGVVIDSLMTPETKRWFEKTKKDNEANLGNTRRRYNPKSDNSNLKEELHNESREMFPGTAPQNKSNKKVFNSKVSDDLTDKDKIALSKAKAAYMSQVKPFVLELERKIEALRNSFKGKRSVSKEAIEHLRKMELLLAKYKMLWFGNEKTMADMNHSEFVALIHEELDLLEGDIASKNPIDVISRINVLTMLINGKGLDGKGLGVSFNEVHDPALSIVRNRFNQLQEQFTEKLVHELIKELNNSPAIKRMLDGKDIKSVSELMELIKSNGDLSYLEKLLKGIGFSDANLGILPEFLKVKLHEVQAKHQGEGNKLRDKLYQADAKVGKDKSFAKERDANGNFTGHLVQLFTSAWRDILQTAKRGAHRVAIYNKYCYRIDYTRIPELHDQFAGMFPEHFTRTQSEMDEHKAFIISKIGQEEYNNMMERAKRKINEYNNLRFVSGEKADRFNPFGEHRGEDDTQYMEWIPKNKRHYNPEWHKLTQEQKDYINTIKEINRYRFNAGVEDQLETSYGKVIAGTLEVVRRTKGASNAAKKLMRGVFKFFFKSALGVDGHGVNSGHIDTLEKFKRETFKYLSRLSAKEMIEWARQKGIKIPDTYLEKKEISNLIANELYKTELEDDMTAVTELMLDMAVNTAMRNEMLPIARNALLQFKRVNLNAPLAVQQMEDFLNKVVKGLKDGESKVLKKILSTNIDLNKIDSLSQIKDIILKRKDLEEHEKEFIEIIKKASDVNINKNRLSFNDIDGVKYHNEVSESDTKFFRDGKEITAKEFESAYAKSLAHKLNNTGVPLTLGSIFRGMNTIILYKYLGINPINGLMNRYQGLRDNKLADDSGWYWTTGNLAKATKFLNGFNLITDGKRIFGNSDRANRFKMLRKLIKQERLEELDKMMIFVKRLGLDIAKPWEQGGLSQFIMDHSIIAPDGKNQLEILLCLMQDIKIKDGAGREHQLFDGEKLVPFETVDLGNGRYTLRLKNEFNTEENIVMFEDFQSYNGKNVIGDLVAKHTRAVSHIQNNFDGLDTAATNNNMLINSVAMLKRWIVSGYMQRYDRGGTYNLTFNKTNKKGRYIVAAERPGAGIPFLVAQIGLAMGLGSMTALGAGAFGALVLYRLYKTYWKKNTREQIDMQRDTLGECMLFFKSAVLGAMDFPISTLTMGKYSLLNKAPVATQYLTADEVGAIKALGREVGIQASMLAISYLVLSGLHDDDTEDDLRKKRFYNYMANRITSIVVDNQVYIDPKTAVESISRVGLVDYITNLREVLDLDNKTDQQKDALLAKLIPLPNTLTNTLVYGTPTVSERDFSPEIIKRAVKGDGDNKDITKIRANFAYRLKNEGYANQSQIRQLARMYLGAKGKEESDADYNKRIANAYNNLDFDAIKRANPPIAPGEKISRSGGKGKIQYGF